MKLLYGILLLCSIPALAITQKKAADINQLISDIKTGKVDEPTARKRAKIVLKYVSINSPQRQALQEVAQQAGIFSILQDQTSKRPATEPSIEKPTEPQKTPIIGQTETTIQESLLYTQQEHIHNQEKLKSMYNTLHTTQPGTTEYMTICQQITNMKKEVEKKIQTLHTQEKTTSDTHALVLIQELLKGINALREYATHALYSALDVLDDEAYTKFRTIPEWQNLSKIASYISDSLRHLNQDYTKPEQLMQLCNEMILTIQKNIRKIQSSKEQKSG